MVSTSFSRSALAIDETLTPLLAIACQMRFFVASWTWLMSMLLLLGFLRFVRSARATRLGYRLGCRLG